MRKRGPLVVQGQFELRDGEGRAIDLGGRDKVLLCRCGHSETSHCATAATIAWGSRRQTKRAGARWGRGTEIDIDRDARVQAGDPG